MDENCGQNYPPRVWSETNSLWCFQIWQRHVSFILCRYWHGTCLSSPPCLKFLYLTPGKFPRSCAPSRLWAEDRAYWELPLEALRSGSPGYVRQWEKRGGQDQVRARLCCREIDFRSLQPSCSFLLVSLCHYEQELTSAYCVPGIFYSRHIYTS